MMRSYPTGAGGRRSISSVVLPDDDMADLIEAAFLEGQIDGSRADLAYLWLMQNRTEVR